MHSHSSAHFLDRPRNEVIAGLEAAGIPLQMQSEILFDYDKGTLGEAVPMLYKPVVEDSKIGLVRRDFNDLDIREKLRVVSDDIDGFEGLIDTSGLSEGELYNRLKKPTRSGVIYDDMVDILSSKNVKRSGRNAVLSQGPGQVGSPGRNGGKGFGIKGNNSDAVRNAAQFLTDPPIDRLTGTPVSYPQQGHTLDANNYTDLARDFVLMRAQQATPNMRDGADAKGLVTMTRNEMLSNERMKSIAQLSSLVDENLDKLSDTEIKRFTERATAKERVKRYQITR